MNLNLRKPNINYIDQKIFINNLNSWFSNFLIEEFRTDYLPENKIQTIISGTSDPSGGPLPKLFEPNYTTIELGYDYSQDVFNNDIFIFNLDDAYLPEVEFVIRGLQNIEIEKEKILILVSNVMTWGETPLKIYTEEDMKKEGFNEEEVPEVEDNIKFDEEKEENENKKNTEENNDNLENQENNNEINNNSNNALIKESQKSLKGLKEEIPEEKKEEDKQFGDTIEEEELENESQIKNNEEEIKQPEEPKKKFFYYKETEYNKRLPNLKYIYYKILESNVLNNKNPKLKAYVICPGFIYGCGEDIFFNYFKLAWMQQLPFIPLVGEGKNYIPTIHILDLVKIIRKVIEKKPEQKYFFVADKTKNPYLKNILNSIGMGIGGIPVKKLNRFSIENIELPNYTELKIDLRIKISNIFEEQRKEKENIMDYKERQFKWHCEYGIPENIDKLRDEFNLYRNLRPIKIVITGPPCGGKTTLCEFISKKYRINTYKINQFCDWAKNLNDEFGEETHQKMQEIEENLVKAQDEYDHRKNKRKTDPPLDTSQIKKFSSEFMGKILQKRLSLGECSTKGYILDNYPKTYEDCVNMYCTTPFDIEKKDKYELNNKIIPDSVIIIYNYLEENLRNKLQKTENYQQNQIEIDSRFSRRLALYKQQNELVEENKKFLKDFYNEYNIDVYFLDEQKYMLNKDEEEKKVIEFLERNGSIDNYGNLQDIDDIIPYIDTPLDENINMPNEEQILFEQNGGPFNLKKNVDIIKEEVTENNNAPSGTNNINTNQENNQNQNDANNNNINSPKQETTESKNNTKKDNTLTSKKEEVKTTSENNKETSNEQKTEQQNNLQQKIEEEKEIKEKKEEEIKKEEKKVILTEEQKLEIQMKALQEREKKLLEKKSEVLRRYLNENVMPILAKGILSVCENMPDDPVDALANFLLENSFNMQKGKIGEIEKIIENE